MDALARRPGCRRLLFAARLGLVMPLPQLLFDLALVIGNHVDESPDTLVLVDVRQMLSPRNQSRTSFPPLGRSAI